jgi:phosphoribosylaminoimidazolecarboxamide formyltransferase/IMP cyclohydrolase
MLKTIKSALVSVYHKDHIEPIIRELHQLGVTLYSTGGTQHYIETLGIPVFSVEGLTGYPSILCGRVKTLHPKVFGGILARRNYPGDLDELAHYEIPEIDAVIVDLYPFEQTLLAGYGQEELIEKIDIGGIALIRAAAKNFYDTLVVASPEQYSELFNILKEKKGVTSLEERKKFAALAFHISSHYDMQIFNYLNREGYVESLKISEHRVHSLRYGENPHQRAWFFGDLDANFDVLNGKELSYNNLVDVDAALQLVAEFSEPTCAIIKHSNSCGLASRDTLCDAYRSAFACDTLSAFGGVIAVNSRVDNSTAAAMNDLFFEVLVAPDFEDQALQLLKGKKNRILLRQKKLMANENKMIKSSLNGFLVQEPDRQAEKRNQFTQVTTKVPSEAEISDLEFAVIAVKHLKSNGIAIVKNKQLIGSNSGQTSRVDALKYALSKAASFGFDVGGAVMASDAFFPFPDCVEIASLHGISAIVQPGGSINDKLSIEAAEKAGIAMVFTGVRHFKH